jgi:hypothetical protein
MNMLADLDRRFYKAQGNDAEAAADNNYLWMVYDEEYGQGIKWPNLLQNKIVVVLGEAGSGKSKEFIRQAEILRKESRTVFSGELSRLITDDFEGAFGSSEFRRLRDWKASNESGYFFFDSIDESKLKQHDDFFRALDKIRWAIEEKNLSRAHLIFSSRISEWRVETDKQEVLKRLGTPTSETSAVETENQSNDSLLLVHLAPLDSARVHTLAAFLEVDDADAFIKALDDNHAWEFARRPLDVIALIEYWKGHNNLGSLTDLMEFSISQRLKEARPGDELAASAARTGVEFLAAAAIFCKTMHFKIPDPSHIASDALKPMECLPEGWNEVQCQSLLKRAIFDDAIYGCVRFHHRREQEYLAAYWLTKLCRIGCPLDQIENVLFETLADGKVLRPSLAPVTAWLAAGNEPLNEHIRELLLNYAPEIHLRYGDPSQLTLEYKKRVLKTLSENYSGKKRVWIESESGTLARLSDSSLTSDICEIIRNPELAVDFREDVVLMAWRGGLKGCLETLYALVTNDAAPKTLRNYSAWALRDHADNSLLGEIKAYALNQTRLNGDLAAIFCEALFPKVMNVAELIDLLQIAERNEQRTYDLPWHLEKIAKNCPRNLVVSLFKGLMGLVQTPPFLQNHQDFLISERFYWLREVLPTLLQKVLETKNISEDEANLAGQCIQLLEDHWHDRGKNEEVIRKALLDAIKNNPRVRRAYFWKGVETYRHQWKNDPVAVSQIFGWRGHNLISEQASDSEWLIQDVHNMESHANRILALRFCFNLWNPYRLRGLYFFTLLKAYLPLSNHHLSFWKYAWNRIVAPLNRIWWRYIKHGIFYRYWWDPKIRRFMRIRHKIRDQYILHRYIRSLRTGKHIANLRFLLDEMGGNQSRYTTTGWDRLKRNRGARIAKATRRGCEAAWTVHSPQLPHEKENPNEVYAFVMVGLCGIQSLWASGKINFSDLSYGESQRAFRYALSEMNGFPEWLPDLAQAQPDAVRDILTSCIHGEWDFSGERQFAHEVIYDVFWHGGFLAPLILISLEEKLVESDPKHVQILESSLSFILKFGNKSSSQTIENLVPERLALYNTESPFLVAWLAFWLEVNAEKALSWLKGLLDSSDPLQADRLMLRLCHELQREFRKEKDMSEDPDFFKPAALQFLIPLVFKHVRPEEDNHAQSGLVTPRDDAERFRGSLLTILARSKDSEARDLLRRLELLPEMSSTREWIAHLAKEHISNLSDHNAWKPKDVGDFAKEYEVEPRNEFDLFKVACNRLQDIKSQVERAENTLRDEVQTNWDERQLRRWLGRKLQGSAHNRYTLPQEAEIDRQERIDLRFDNPYVKANVPVELKWAEKWSTNNHFERLEKQLVGQYLRAENIHCGIYLLCRIDSKRTWQHPTTGTNIEFEELAALLGEKANALERSQSGVWRIRVVAIDFSSPDRKRAV